MTSEWHFIVSKANKDEENRNLRRDMVRDNDGRLALRDIVPIVKGKEDNDETTDS